MLQVWLPLYNGNFPSTNTKIVIALVKILVTGDFQRSRALANLSLGSFRCVINSRPVCNEILSYPAQTVTQREVQPYISVNIIYKKFNSDW